MTEKTLTIAQLRAGYIDMNDPTWLDQAIGEEFDRAIAAHDAEVAANARAEALAQLAITFNAIKDVHAGDPNMQNAIALVNAEADRLATHARIEREAGSNPEPINREEGSDD